MRIFALAFAIFAACAAPAAAQHTGFLTATVADVGRPYDVIDSVCVYQEFPRFSLRGDPLQNALAGAFQQVQERARAAQADALVGFDVDFTSPAQGEEGRLLLCGTLVKFRT